MTLLAIDPGKCTGWALFDGAARLVACGVGEPPVDDPARVVIESPVVYARGRTRNPKSIVKLATNMGGHAKRYALRDIPVALVEPHTWKGNIDPDVINERARARLDAQELEVFERAMREQRIPKGKQHNVLDAIGIGLFSLGRWSR